MRLFQIIAAAGFALALSAGASFAATGTATTNLALRAAPSSNTERLATIPAGERVQIAGCSGGWCKVRWDGHAGYAAKSGLAVQVAARNIRGPVYVPGGELWPVVPHYPYRAGHYPKLDWYDRMPPYTAISPSFYHRRFFMMTQESGRYRYLPHVFHGNQYRDDAGGIGHVDIQGISEDLKENYQAD
jgi:hypothetical protein